MTCVVLLGGAALIVVATIWLVARARAAADRMARANEQLRQQLRCDCWYCHEQREDEDA